jgi:hypothetical protein
VTGRPRRGIVDMNRQEATIIIMCVEQRELLMTMCDNASIVDIECDGLRGRGVTGAIKIDEDAAQLHSPGATWWAASTGPPPYRASARKRA